MFDRFDICAAYNLWSQHYGWDLHKANIQARLSRLSYRPCSREQTLEGLSENARAIYDGLVARGG